MIYLLYSYANQNAAVQGKEAAMADPNPLNILTSPASFTKSLLLFDAYIRVLIESIGNIAMSHAIPPIPPAKTDTVNT